MKGSTGQVERVVANTKKKKQKHKTFHLLASFHKLPKTFSQLKSTIQTKRKVLQGLSVVFTNVLPTAKKIYKYE